VVLVVVNDSAWGWSAILKEGTMGWWFEVEVVFFHVSVNG
jgi:hypothetical protein